MRSKKRKEGILNKEVIAVILIVITLIIIINMSIKGNSTSPISNTALNIVSPIQRGINKVFDGLGENVSGILNYRKNIKKIEKLTQENNKLRKKIIDIDLKRDELQALEGLKKSLNYLEENNTEKYISASVVSKNDGNWYTTFTISAGKKDGVVKDGIVISGEGLVGRVYEVSDNYSKAISILNNKSAISFEVLRKTEYTGVLSQNISMDSSENFEGYLKGYLFDIKYEVVPGDIIITSGIGIYPKGIPVGEVEKVIEDKNNLLKYVKIKPYSNLKKIDKVLILLPRRV